MQLEVKRVWEKLENKNHLDTRKLIVSALTRSHNLPVSGGYYAGKITFDWVKRTFPNPLAYFIEHLDGFKTTMILTSIRDFNYAGLRADNNEIISNKCITHAHSWIHYCRFLSSVV